jgi:hydroxyacylglutathione hydrolase
MQSPKFRQVAGTIHLLESPFAGLWSGIYLSTRGLNILIDSGANAETVDKCLIPALKAMGLELNDIDILLNTHCHGDHIGGHFRIRELSKLKIATFHGSLDKLRDPLKYSKLIRARFPEFSPPPPPVLLGVEPDILLEDGEKIGPLKLIHTPGHDSDCICLLDEADGTLISGDSIQGAGTPMQGVGLYMSLPNYRDALGKLLKMDIERLAFGHHFQPFGPLVEGRGNVRESLGKCLSLTELYDRLMEAARLAGARSLPDAARRTLKEIGEREPPYLFLALHTLSEHWNGAT